MSDVPCNGCRRCCIKDAVRLLDHEDPYQWKTVPHERYPLSFMLAHKANGECVYLGPEGCTIHDQKRPQQCTEMDCRNVYRGITYTKARKLNVLHIWKRGRELLSE